MKAVLASAESALRQTFGREPEWRFLVPGRLEVFGKHTDYAGGHSLVAAVPRGFALAAVSATDGAVDVVDAVSGARVSCRIGEHLPNRPAGWLRYVDTVVRRLARNFPSVDLSCRIVLGSNLPSAAGISTSSALVIGIAEALIARARIEETSLWRDVIRGDEDRAAYFGCIENGAAFKSLTGDDGVGTHGGSEDHAAIVMGRADALAEFSFVPLRFNRCVRMPREWTFVVVSTGVRASKTGAAQQVYNQLAAEAAAIRNGAPLTPRLADRLAQLRAENGRVTEAADAFAREDIARIGELAAESQRDAERWLGNQVPETIDLVALAREVGAAAASAFGAGWGGSVWALARTAEAQALLRELTLAYQAKYPQHRSAGFVSPPAHGLQRLGAGARARP